MSTVPQSIPSKLLPRQAAVWFAAARWGQAGVQAGLLTLLLTAAGCRSTTPAPSEPDRTPTLESSADPSIDGRPAGGRPGAGAAASDVQIGPAPVSTGDPGIFFEVLETHPADAATTLEVESLRLLSPSATRWRVVAGHARSSEFEWVVAPAEHAERFGRVGVAGASGDSSGSGGGPAGAVLSAGLHPTGSDAPGAPIVAVRIGDEQTMLLEPSSDGGVAMPLTISHGDRAVSLFDPPLGIASARLTFGTPFSSESAMRVVDERDRSREIQSGQATRSFAIVDRCRIRTPMGDFDVIRVEVEFRARLSLASAQERAVQYIDPTLGTIAEERRKVIRAVGIFGRTVEQTIVRIE